MNNLLIILFLSLAVCDNTVAQVTNNWTKLTITRFCTVDDKYCKDKLTVNIKGQITYEPCGQNLRIIKIDNNLIDKLKTKKKTLEHWREITHIDTVCGYLIEADNSNTEYVIFDINPDFYDQQEIKDYIVVVNDIFDEIQ